MLIAYKVPPARISATNHQQNCALIVCSRPINMLKLVDMPTMSRSVITHEAHDNYHLETRRRRAACRLCTGNGIALHFGIK